jgi:hypothetical protein
MQTSMRLDGAAVKRQLTHLGGCWTAPSFLDTDLAIHSPVSRRLPPCWEQPQQGLRRGDGYGKSLPTIIAAKTFTAMRPAAHKKARVGIDAGPSCQQAVLIARVPETKTERTHLMV